DGGGDDELLSPAETVIVWRCQDCGGVDAPQPCIDVCIWGPADWVDGASYESERSRAAVDREVEQSLAGLLRRLAFATPRDGRWERSWRAFQSQARLADTARRPPARARPAGPGWRHSRSRRLDRADGQPRPPPPPPPPSAALTMKCGCARRVARGLRGQDWLGGYAPKGRDDLGVAKGVDCPGLQRCLGSL